MIRTFLFHASLGVIDSHKISRFMTVLLVVLSFMGNDFAFDFVHAVVIDHAVEIFSGIDIFRLIKALFPARKGSVAAAVTKV